MKQQAKSNLEREQLMERKSHLEQTVAHLEAKKEHLIHEIEMLRARSPVLTSSSHKYSIQPYRKPTGSTCAESSHSVLVPRRIPRSPVRRLESSNSPGRRTMVSGTLSDSITAVGDNDSFLNLGESEAEHYNSIVKSPLYPVKHHHQQRRSPFPPQ